MTEKRAGERITEGYVKKGGVKPVPNSPKPNVRPVGQNPPSTGQNPPSTGQNPPSTGQNSPSN